MKIIFLGTSAMVPTKQRNHTGVLISHEAENILVDCGENIQRQMKIVGIPPTKITKILITHWHGDHVLGLPGLIQTLASNNYNKTLEIYGPEKSKKFLDAIFKTYILEGRIKTKITEIKKDGVFLEKEFYSLEAKKLSHDHSACLAYSFREEDKRKINVKYIREVGIPRGPLLGKLQKGKEIRFKGRIIAVEKATILKKGKKLSIILDTQLCKPCYEIAKNSDILICEATYLHNLKNKAKEYKHLTAKQAALIARKSNAKKLVLTHFSQRYKDTTDLKNEAKKVFKNTICAEDFMKLNL